VRPGLEPGAVFARYRIESLVGRGGMGVVYRATDLSLERPVALKLIVPELAGDEHFRERFLKEPKLAASLDHPNVVPIYAAGELDGQLYLAMRYVEGSDLKTLIGNGGKLAPERALSILGQVAGALDAAHRRGLVHRDVKPANVLLDADGHTYLTDFGITKQVGGASTDTGQMVGTLDYLAPEQIRGERVDARTDCYSLACVLYECLAGTPPFHRQTEAETMWAHMQEQPAPLRSYPALDPVLQRALAKEPDERPDTCSELIDEAREVLGLERRAAPAFAPAALVRRRRSLLVAGAALLLCAIAAAIVALTTGGDSESVPLGNGVARIEPGGGKLAGFTATEAVPGNVTVGEGATWVLSSEGEKTISRIDSETAEVVKTFEPGGLPAEIAAGGGALWVGNVGGNDFATTLVSVSRIDPDSGRVTRTTKLPGGDAGSLPTAGLPRIAVGDGGVWAINPDGSVSRIDPRTGRIVARIRTEFPAWTIAAGEEGVWYLSIDNGQAVMGIDPRTNRVTQTVKVGAEFLWGVAVGGGSVWTTAQAEGLLWRIEPGPDPITRTIDVGPGVTFVAYGDGAAWTGNYMDGTVSRVDPDTNDVTTKTSVGTPQALAVGEDAAWVSVAGGTIEGRLPAPACGEVVSGGETPDVLIASDFPLRGAFSADPRAAANAVRTVIEQHGFRAGDHAVGYQSCDVSTQQSGNFEFRKCAANANAYAHAEQLVAVVGTWSSYCAEVQLPITNRAPGGPLATVSPSNTGPSLTRGPPLAEGRGVPDIFYPTGTRHYARVVPREDAQGVAYAMLAKRLGLKGVYVVYMPDWPRVEHARPFERAARRLGVEVSGSRAFDPEARSYDGLVNRVARSGADGVFLAAPYADGGGRVLQALRARLGGDLTVMTTDVFQPIPEILDEMGPAARGVYVSTTDTLPVEKHLTPAGRQFARDFGAVGTPTYYVLPAAQAAEVVLEAIARSDGSRGSVLEELFQVEVKDGILGSFRFDRNGDIVPARIPIMRITGKSPPNSGVPTVFQGAEVERVVTVPAELLAE
jgi:ABC-type branched-subunit amino acid transport system substrate-binding protein/DNA-binding beta-propeller fold protein YncE